LGPSADALASTLAAAAADTADTNAHVLYLDAVRRALTAAAAADTAEAAAAASVPQPHAIDDALYRALTAAAAADTAEAAAAAASTTCAEARSSFVSVVLLYLACSVALGALGGLSSLCFNLVGRRIIVSVRDTVFRQIIKQVRAQWKRRTVQGGERVGGGSVVALLQPGGPTHHCVGAGYRVSADPQAGV
jgi:hypothetical protein